MVGSKKITEAQISDTTIQLMEFVVAGGWYGINIAKVSEIIKYTQHPITPMPNSNPFVEGIFKPREDTMTVVNLAAYMGLPPSEDPERDILIVIKLNNIKTAFHVHGVEAICVVPIGNIEKPDSIIYGGEESMATGVAKHENKLITIIDFEKVMIDISPSLGFEDTIVERVSSRGNSTKPILIVEDSPLLERMILNALEKAGYTNIVCTNNGREAWELLKKYRDGDQPIEHYVSAIISDIEMPIMDGHTLIKLITSDLVLRKVPIIVFSSIITDEMRAIGEKLGVVASIGKPEIVQLVDIIGDHIL